MPRAKPARVRPAIAKISCPRPRPVFLRTRLLAWLDAAAADTPVLWIQGPPGAGKTTLAVNWVSERAQRVLWYQVDAADRDVATFFHFLGLALARAAPRYRTPLPKLASEYRAGLPTFARNFFRELARRLKPPFVLVLDNVQEAGADAALYEVLREGLEELPPGACALLTSRARPPEALARWQLDERLKLLDWPALRLTEEEAGPFARFLDPEPQAPDAAERGRALYRRCDGWLAGMVLLRHDPEPAPGVHAPLDAGSAQRVFDYFAGEVFNRRHPAVKEFLMQTALFPSFTVEMAERLSGARAARSLVHDLVRQHHFIEQLAGPRARYRYHPLFRSFLLARVATAFGPAELARLRHRAAALLEREGLFEQALALYLESGDWDAAGRVILSQARGLLASGRFETLHQAIARLPAAVVEQEPWLLHWRGLSRLPVAPGEARVDLEAAYERFDDADDAAGLYLTLAAIIDSFFFEWGDFRRADRWVAALRALRRRHPRFPSPEVEWRAVPAIVCILCHRHMEHPDLTAWAERAEAMRRAVPHPDQQRAVAWHLAAYYTMNARKRELARVIDDVAALDERSLANPVIRVLWNATFAGYEWQYRDPEAARRRCEEGLRVIAACGWSTWKYQVLSHGVYSGLVVGDLAWARGYLQQMKALARDEGRPEAALYHHLASMVAMHADELAEASEHAATALRLLDQAGLQFVYATALYVCANVAFALGDAARAAEQLAMLRRIGEEKDSRLIGQLCRLGEAAFAFASRNDEQGLAALRAGLVLSHACGGPALPWLPRAVLARLYAAALEHDVEPEHVVRLIRRFRIAAPPEAYRVDSWPFAVKIHTFGNFRVRVGGRPLRFATKAQKKPLELLKALIALGGNRVPEHRLAELLWPDAEGDAALHALASALYRLRKLIGENAVKREDGALTLDPRHCWIDLWAFERLLAESDRVPPGDGPGTFSSNTERALALYRGAFLASEPDAAWALSMRERLRARLLRHLDAAAGRFSAGGRHEQALRCYQRALEIDALAETFYRGLIRCYLATGRRAEALMAYHRCRRLLENELGVAPAPETDALVRGIAAD